MSMLDNLTILSLIVSCVILSKVCINLELNPVNPTIRRWSRLFPLSSHRN